MSLVHEADIQSTQSANSSVGIVLDFSKYFDRSVNTTSDLSGSGQSNGALQICDAFWCERKNHKKKSSSMAQSRKGNEGKSSNFSSAVQNFLDTTPCPMETMARNYLCIRFQVNLMSMPVTCRYKKYYKRLFGPTENNEKFLLAWPISTGSSKRRKFRISITWCFRAC